MSTHVLVRGHGIVTVDESPEEIQRRRGRAYSMRSRRQAGISAVERPYVDVVEARTHDRRQDRAVRIGNTLVLSDEIINVRPGTFGPDPDCTCGAPALQPGEACVTCGRTDAA